MFFLERSGFFAALLDTRLLSKSLRLTVRADALTPSCCQYWASSALVSTRFHRWLLRRRRSWGLLDTLGRPEPSSPQLSLSPWSSWSGKLLFQVYVRPFWCRDDGCICFFGGNHWRPRQQGFKALLPSFYSNQSALIILSKIIVISPELLQLCQLVILCQGQKKNCENWVFVMKYIFFANEALKHKICVTAKTWPWHYCDQSKEQQINWCQKPLGILHLSLYCFLQPINKVCKID